jgi:hypothetical protein
VKRYKVATCDGWPINPGGRTGNRPPGLTASILDTHLAHREVKRFRTEWLSNRISGPVHRRRETMRKAQEYADKLNAECA